MSYYTGIDIGSTATKVVVLSDEALVDSFVIPTGWSSREAADQVAARLAEAGHPVDQDMRVIATGYGRISVDFAAKSVTEITCHAKGAYALMGRDCQLPDERQVLGGHRKVPGDHGQPPGRGPGGDV